MRKASPTGRKRQLGAALRRLRRACELTGDEVAAQLEWSSAKVSNVETARVSSHPNDIKLLLDLYAVHDEDQRERLLQLCRESRERGWWQEFGSAVEPWASRYIGLEDAASSIRYFGIDLVYGPMQTEEYARAVVEAGAMSAGRAHVERVVRLRLARRRLFSAPDGPRVRAVLDESVLRRRVGGPGVMREQLLHLARLAEEPGLELRVLPFEGGAHPVMGNQFQILGFEDGGDIVYLESMTGAQYLDKGVEVDGYGQVFDRLVGQALDTSASLEMLRSVAGEHR
ncbi:helix-turn-helix domain-containing protein [Parasphingorhabdus pacifica]